MKSNKVDVIQGDTLQSNWVLRCGDYTLDFSKRTYVMGILNITPDSFSDGGKFLDSKRALDHVLRMVDDGADVIDVGGESARPGAQPVPFEEERTRVLPLIEKLSAKVKVAISIDTTKAAMARDALDAGAVMVNDISALRFDPEMASLISERDVPVILMHMRGTPLTMQHQPVYESLIPDVYSFLDERIHYAESVGIDAQKIIIDPGIGFGKSVPEGNLTIVKHLSHFTKLKKPILVGPSRKAFIGKVLNLDVEEREEGTAAVVALSVGNGANIVRVHDVKKMKRVVSMVDAVMAMN